MATPLITPSATKHGVTEETMIHAVYNSIAVEEMDGDLSTFIGPGLAGNLLEMGVVHRVDGPLAVHAMAARPKHLRHR